MHYTWGTNGKVERVWPSWQHTPHFCPEQPTFSDGILCSFSRVHSRGAFCCPHCPLWLGPTFWMQGRWVMNCPWCSLSACVDLISCKQFIRPPFSALTIQHETKFNSDNWVSGNKHQQMEGLQVSAGKGFLVSLLPKLYWVFLVPGFSLEKFDHLWEHG